MTHQNSNDRELLELAAKAAGYKPDGSCGAGLLVVVDAGLPTQEAFSFNPRDDDGDSRRLQVRLRLQLTVGRAGCSVSSLRSPDIDVDFTDGCDEDALVRLAVLQAAAAIGRAMP